MYVNKTTWTCEPSFGDENLGKRPLSPIEWYRLIMACIISLCCVVLQARKWCSSPNPIWNIPGPMSLPLIGSVLSIGPTPHFTFSSFRRKYGNIFRIQIGSIPVVVLNGYSITKEALVEQGDVFSGRPDLFTFRLASEGLSMAFNSFSLQWKAHRRVAERALKLSVCETGFVERIVTKEAHILADTLLKEVSSCPRDPVRYITWSVAHVMYSLCFGDSRKSPDFECMINNTLRLIHCHKLGNILNFFPWAQRLLKSTYNELQEICGNIIKVTKIHEKHHLETYKNGQIRDALDALIFFSKKPSCTLDRDRMLHTVQEYIGAGMDIVFLSLTWAILYLSRHKQIRQQLMAEVDAVLGPRREPDLSDLKNMPLTHAFILETLRFSSVVPFSLPHTTLRDTELGGYSIPAGTFVLVNLHAIHTDPDLWGDPEIFRPHRFLNEHTGELSNEVLRFFCPFGVGRRKCVGENVSIHQLFVYLAVLMQRCDFFQSENTTEMVAPGSGILLKPDPFVIQVKQRS